MPARKRKYSSNSTRKQQQKNRWAETARAAKTQAMTATCHHQWNAKMPEANGPTPKTQCIKCGGIPVTCPDCSRTPQPKEGNGGSRKMPQVATNRFIDENQCPSNQPGTIHVAQLTNVGATFTMPSRLAIYHRNDGDTEHWTLARITINEPAWSPETRAATQRLL